MLISFSNFRTCRARDLLDAAEQTAKVHGGKCPRASVATMLYDKDGNWLTSATNARFDGQCDCNDGADTLTTASSTCCAVHSEVGALLAAAKQRNWDKLWLAVVTRPPCCKCLPLLLESPVQVIITGTAWPDRDNTRPVWERFGRMWLTA